MNPSRNHVAFAIWIIFSAAILIFVAQHRTVSINYWMAARHWLTQSPLYHNGVGFIYLPQSAIIYSLLTFFPFVLSEKIWRMISVAIFIWGFFRYLDLCAELLNAQKYAKSLFLWLSILAIPLCFDSIRNGQMHLMMTGLMMLATSAIHQKKWLLATFLISLSFF